MTFSQKFNNMMQELHINQARVAQMTGIGKSSISQYAAGEHEPSKARRTHIATSLGLQPDYFDEIDPVATLEGATKGLTVKAAAELMGTSPTFIRNGLITGALPFGFAVRNPNTGTYRYWISPVRFTEYTGIKIIIKEQE